MIARVYGEEYSQGFEPRSYKQQSKPKKLPKMHKTPDGPNTPKYIFGKYIPIEHIRTVGNIKSFGNMKVKTRYAVHCTDLNGLAKIIKVDNTKSYDDER